MLIGYHASHEQFSPRELLALCTLAEESGFSSIMSSDHITPWSVRQGNSGFVWAWLAAALQNNTLPFGSLAIPGGSRYHPVVLAQTIATIADMFPKRLTWIAAGSGEAMNEHVTGEPWPQKAERQQRLYEAVEIMRELWSGEEVTKTASFLKAHKAKLWGFQKLHMPVYIAALSPETAEWAASWADGLITVRQEPYLLKDIITAFKRGGGDGKPLKLQYQLSWAESKDEARYNAWHQWRHAAVEKDLVHKETPEDIDQICEKIRPEDMEKALPISHDPEQHLQWLLEYADLGFETIYLHNAGRNQKDFIRTFGERVVPNLQDK